MILKNEKQLSKKSLFIDVAYRWVDIMKGNVKEQTYQKYWNLIYNHLKDSLLLNIAIHKVTENVIIEFITEKESCGRLDKTAGLSASTIKTLLYVLKSVYRFGVKEKICKEIDLSKIKYTKKNKIKIEVLRKTEQMQLESYLKQKMNVRKLGILLCFYTGLRIGEICSLKWDCIDLDNKELKVKHTAQRIQINDPKTKSKTKLIVCEPKSKTSIRTIPIPDFLVNLLREYQLPDNYYLLSQKATPYDPRGYEYFFTRLLKNCNLRHVKFHVLRHTFATRAIEAGMDIKTLSELLGHSSVDITLAIYVHSSIELKRNSLQKLVTFMNTSIP